MIQPERYMAGISEVGWPMSSICGSGLSPKYALQILLCWAIWERPGHNARDGYAFPASLGNRDSGTPCECLLRVGKPPTMAFTSQWRHRVAPADSSCEGLADSRWRACLWMKLMLRTLLDCVMRPCHIEQSHRAVHQSPRLHPPVAFLTHGRGCYGGNSA